MKECLLTGADAIHFHVRDKNGNESLFPEDVNRIFLMIREELLGASIGISTGSWILPDYSERIKAIENWQMNPDFVSVNIDEEEAEEISDLFINKKIGVEAGISYVEEAEKFIKFNSARNFTRILIEPQEQNIEEADKIVREIEIFLDKSKIAVPRLLHGFEKTTWHFVRESVKKGHASRIGFEDVLFLPDGRETFSNSDLVFEALNIINYNVNDL